MSIRPANHTPAPEVYSATLDWCQHISRHLPYQDIHKNGQPYLERFYLAGWHPPHPDLPAWRHGNSPALYLHRFVNSDPDHELHTHPWSWSQSLILHGGYHEQRCNGDNEIEEHTYQPGDTNTLEPGDKHRVDLIDGDCWTLFMAGTYHQPWGFYDTC